MSKMYDGTTKTISIAFLRERVNYDPETGEFTWKTSRFKSFVGKPAGWWTASGYRIIQFQDDKYLAHRVAYALMVGRWPRRNVDHRDGDSRNNRWANLRPATQSENSCNRGIQSNCRSGVQGVVWREEKQQWMAYANRQGKFHLLGYFDDIRDAAEARRIGALRLHGKFAFVARPK